MVNRVQLLMLQGSRFVSCTDSDAMGTVRESPVVASVYVRYEKSLENQAKAVQARAERQHRDEIRQQMATEQYEETQERRNRVRGASKAAKYDLVNRNREKGQIVRDERRVDVPVGAVPATRGDAQRERVRPAVVEQTDERRDVKGERRHRERVRRGERARCAAAVGSAARCVARRAGAWRRRR